MAAASLAVRISAQIGEFQKSFNDASRTVNKFAGEFEGIATRAAAVGSFIGTIAADIARSIASGLGSAIRDAVKFSSEFSNAFIGLGSVARAFGTDSNLATTAAKRLSSDGLLPLKDSATGLKNLLATGFSLPQAIKLMDAFKDSSAFGRQSSLSFGDAVRSATEGVKNGNSILVDNSGITKNLSQILKEAGFSAQDLSRASSDAGVRMALFNGILKEAAAQTGDAQKLTQTYSGQVSRLDTAYTNLLASLGTVITQNATVATGIGFISDAFTGLNTQLSNNGAGFRLVSDAVIKMVEVLAGSVRALDTVQIAFNTIDTALVTFTSHVIEGVKTLADQLLNLVNIAATIPGSGIALSGMANQIIGLAAISKGAGIELATLGTRILDNEGRSKRWHGTLSDLAGSLDTLKGEMAATRGQTVELGTANGPLSAAAKVSATNLEALGKKAQKAADEVKQLSDEMLSVVGEVGKLDAKIGHFGDGFTKAVENLVNRVNGVPLSDKAHEWAEALKEPGVAAKVLADTHLRKELNGVITEVIDKFGSLKAAGVDALNAIGGQTFRLPELTPLTQLPGTVVAITPPVVKPSIDSLQILTRAFDDLAGHSDAAFAGIVKGAADITAALDQSRRFGSIGILTPLFDADASASQKWAAGVAASAQIASGAMDVWRSSANDGSKAAGAFHGALSGASAGAAFGPYGAAIGAAAGAVIGFIHTLSAGRRAVEDFAASFDTIAAGSGFDELHAKLAKLPEGLGESFWKRLTQQVKKGDKAGAQSVINQITLALNEAAVNDPATIAAGFGFKTQRELQELANQASKTYTFMRDSGLYTAAAISDAFQKSKDAQIAALGETSSAASDALKDMNAQILSLQQSIANEAPEEIMGIIEQQTRAQIDAIVKQRDEAQVALDQTAALAATSAELAAKAIDDTLAAHDFVARIKVYPEYIGFPDGFGGSGVPKLAQGGIVRRPTLALVGESGPEAVVPLSQFSGGGGGSTLDVTLVMPDGEVLLRQVVKAKKRLGL